MWKEVSALWASSVGAGATVADEAAFGRFWRAIDDLFEDDEAAAAAAAAAAAGETRFALFPSFLSIAVFA